MLRIRCFARVPILTCLTMLLPVGSLFAQRTQIDVEEVDIHGTVLRISPLSLIVKTELGTYDVDIVNREFVNLGPAPIEVKGEKPRKFLQRGMTVRFTGKVDGRKIREPLTEITVVDPAAVVALGAAARDGRGTDPEEAELGRLEGKGQVFVGQLRTFRLNVLSIEVPEEPRSRIVQATLADDAVVKISFANLSAASPGDKVQVKALREVGPRANRERVWAESVTVTTSAAPADRISRRAQPVPTADRRAFGELADTEEGAAADGPKYKGVILEIN